jgi:hypothetical protein
MPDPGNVLQGVFCEGEAEVLGDGQAPWSGFASPGAAAPAVGSAAAQGGDR